MEFPLKIQLTSWPPLDNQLVLVSEEFYNLLLLLVASLLFSGIQLIFHFTHTQYTVYVHADMCTVHHSSFIFFILFFFPNFKFGTLHHWLDEAFHKSLISITAGNVR